VLVRSKRLKLALVIIAALANLSYEETAKSLMGQQHRLMQSIPTDAQNSTTNQTGVVNANLTSSP
jgi:hypothetical protein